MTENLTQLVARLWEYSLFEIIVELAIIWVVVYLIFRFLRGTRGAGIIKGLGLLLILGTLFVRILGQNGESFPRLNYLYDRSLGFAAIALLVIFQPELRRALIRLGGARIFGSARSELAPMIEAMVACAEFCSKNRFGAVVAIERKVGLGGVIEGGTLLNADASASLLQSIFWPNNPLHDLGVVIRGSKVVAASVQFPLAESGELEQHLGSRHRAAVGITHESDCLAVVISEESGEISVAEMGQLYRNLSVDELRRFLADRILKNIDTTDWLGDSTLRRITASRVRGDALETGFSDETTLVPEDDEPATLEPVTEPENLDLAPSAQVVSKPAREGAGS